MSQSRHVDVAWNGEETFRVGDALASLKFAYRGKSDLEIWR